jgi:hypothetical protein
MAWYEPFSAHSGGSRQCLPALCPHSTREVLMGILLGLGILAGLFLLCALFIRGLEKL